jgi:dephospho-CoA kinase
MLRIGITGGIGSGKSWVCGYFEKLQVPVYNADNEAALLIDTDPVIRRKIISCFGVRSYLKRGLNKPFIRKLVFNNPENLKTLNAITHPPVLKHFDLWCKARKKERHLFVIKEAALIFESDSHKSLDYVACVVAPVETRLQRVMQRDRKTREEVMNIMKKQMTDKEKVKRSDFVISNDGKEPVLPAIVAFHEFILKKSAAYGK